MKKVLLTLVMAWLCLNFGYAQTVLGDFEDQTLQGWETWTDASTISTVANPSTTGNASAYCAKITQDAEWTNPLKKWFSPSFMRSNASKITFDVYVEVAGKVQFSMDNSSAANVDKYLDVEAAAWTTLEIDLSELETFDYKQIYFKFEKAGYILIDNITYHEKVADAPTTVLGDFEDETLQGWETWVDASFISVAANPSQTGNASSFAAKLTQDADWSTPLKKWSDPSFLNNKADKLSFDVYLENAGKVQVSMDNSASGDNLDYYLDVHDAQTWTTLEVDLSTLTAFDYKQLYIKFEKAGYMYLDNIVFHEGVSTAVEQNKLADTRIYPNPFINELNITNASEVYKVELVSLKGSVEYSAIHNGASSLTLDTKNLAKGVYILNMYSNGSVKSQKVIK